MNIKKLLKQAALYSKRKNTDKVIILYEQILAIDPVNPAALTCPGKIYYEPDN